MARIPEQDIERLKEDISVARLVEAAGVELKRSGKDLLGRCPFHGDGEPSLVVTPAKNLWHCFACQIGGGPIDWVMKSRGVSFRHAVELLRDDFSLVALPPAAGSAAPVKRSTVRALAAPVAFDADDQDLLNQTLAYYHERLLATGEASAYLTARGLTRPELIPTFRLGVADRTLGLRLPQKNRRDGAEVRARLQRVGLLRDSGHEHFNGSLVVPIFDEAGDVVEVYGRKLLDNLRAGTPKHLYLPAEKRRGGRGVFNRAGLQGSPEIILCESVLDALTFWCAGFRNVTCAYGVEGFTDEHLAAFKAHNTQRILIAYDRDDAGERAAEKLAARLIGEGFACYRLQFPHGLDANEYALKVQPAAQSLGLLIRKAVGLGTGEPPRREAAVALPTLTGAPVAAAERIQAVAEPTPPEGAPSEALPAAALPPAPALDLAAEVSAQEVTLRMGEGEAQRRWRVRGLAKNLSPGVLKVNVMVATDAAFHVDTLDLYAARARAVFVQQAAAELQVPEALLKTELGRVLLKLEAVQDEAIAQALEPSAPAAPEPQGAAREAALALLRAPDLLERVLADFEACGVVGEATNKLVGYLAATSRLLARPLAVVVQSSSAAGKSSLMDAVLAFMPPEACVRYSALSGQALFYMGQTSLTHKILAIAEEEGASRASYALKLLQSDGALTMASTGTDANGNLVAQDYRVEGPAALFMTTTAIDVDEELMNRCLVLSVDEGRAQTAAIHQRQRERRTLAGLLGQAQREAVLALHRDAQRLLRPLAVVNPFAEQLTFLDDRTRTRRDHEKYLALIDTIALLHQHQRAVKTVALAAGPLDYIEVTPSDIAQANALAHEALGRSLDELPPQTRRLLLLLRDWVEAECARQAMPRSAFRFTRRALRAASGWGDTQLKLHLSRLAELEYLGVHRAAHGAGYVYELRYDGDGGSRPHLAGLLDPASLYDGARSGEAAHRSGAGRVAVGGWTVGGPAREMAATPVSTGPGAPMPGPGAVTRPLTAGVGHA